MRHSFTERLRGVARDSTVTCRKNGHPMDINRFQSFLMALSHFEHVSQGVSVLERVNKLMSSLVVRRTEAWCHCDV